MSKKIYEVHVYDNGDKEWYLSGKHHREDGPAVECANGTKYWYLNGKHHREDGPAIEYADGNKYWYLNGIELSEKAHKRQTSKRDDCAGQEVKINGKRYKLTPV